ncbi:MAG: isochorismatase family protein [candidate division WOR-3 bacterium]
MIRENYFKEGDLRLSALMLELLPFRRKDFCLKLENSALLVIDMQKYFLEEQSKAFVPAAKAIISKILHLVQKYESENLFVVYTRHIDDRPDSIMLRWWKGAINRDSVESSLIDVFCNRKGHYIEKTTYDAFYGTNLEKILRENGVKQVVITGVMTHLCCETTARSAFVRDFDVFFVVDATATYNFELHRASLLNLSHGFAIPVLTEEIK